MSVSLNPGVQLGFQRPLTQLVKRTLTVSNHNGQPVAFKVKTTAPKLYCVRPNSGRIEPGESVDVQVLLQAMREEPPLGAKCKDKFLVQSTFITPSRESKSLNDLWNVVEGDEETKIHQQKLKVVYLPVEGSFAEEEYLDSAQPSILTDKYDTVRQFDGNGRQYDDGTVRPGNGYSHPPNTHPSIPTFDIQPPRSHTPPGSSMPANMHSPTAAEFSPALEHSHHDDSQHIPSRRDAYPTSAPQDTERYLEMSRALTRSEAERQRLQALLDSRESGLAPGLRRRSKALSDDGSIAPGETDDGTMTEHSLMQPEGVPLQVVAIVAFTVFFVTYIFF